MYCSYSARWCLILAPTSRRATGSCRCLCRVGKSSRRRCCRLRQALSAAGPARPTQHRQHQTNREAHGQSSSHGRSALRSSHACISTGAHRHVDVGLLLPSVGAEKRVLCAIASMPAFFHMGIRHDVTQATRQEIGNAPVLLRAPCGKGDADRLKSNGTASCFMLAMLVFQHSLLRHSLCGLHVPSLFQQH